MQPTPLEQPIPSIQFPFASYFGGLTPDHFLPVLVTIVFGLWAIYTVIVAYHWMRYASNTLYTFPAIGLHVFVSLWIAAYALSGFH